jgi:hypothetical protein
MVICLPTLFLEASVKSFLVAIAVFLSSLSLAEANHMNDLLSENLDCVAKKGQEEKHWAYAFRIFDSKPNFCMYRLGDGYGPIETPEMRHFCKPVDRIREDSFRTVQSSGHAGHIVTLLDVVYGRTAMANLPADVKKYFFVHREYGAGTGNVDLYCYAVKRN